MKKIIKQAFTLIELLVVIAIIGILSGLIIVTMNGATQKATIAKAQVFSNSLRNSLMMNLVSEWKFDGSGVADGGAANTAYTQDTWSGTNNCTMPATAPTVYSGSSCVSGSCLSFNGLTDYLNCGNNSNLNITGDITISAWIKPNTLLSDRTILRNGYGINSFTFRQSSGRIGFGYTYSNGTWVNLYTTNSILTTNFQYVVVTISGISLKFYLDGVNVLGNTTGANINNRDVGNRFTSIGNDTVNDQYFGGIIDEIRIYNAAIPISQIKEQYYAGLNKLFTKETITKEEYQNRVVGIK
jgi:prepilin-type N-terminal cleavage/methylation domain-containing protein